MDLRSPTHFLTKTHGTKNAWMPTLMETPSHRQPYQYALEPYTGPYFEDEASLSCQNALHSS